MIARMGVHVRQNTQSGPFDANTPLQPASPFDGFTWNPPWEVIPTLFGLGWIPFFFNLAQSVSWPRGGADPLVLDLDGDGFETTGINQSNIIYFDHDGDGLKNATGWVGADDGFLVMDRNGNGQIDNGSELFGDSTPLYVGGTAVDGFAALAQEDTNHDGIVDNTDTRFSSLRIWRDLNQDGISQSNELFTLEQQGIVSIGAARNDEGEGLGTYPNGNQVTDVGSFVITSGTIGTAGLIDNAADFNLVTETFYRQFPDAIAITPEATALPDMGGSGVLRDLSEAASLSPQLVDILSQYSHATTRTEQLSLLDPLMLAWADTGGLMSTVGQRLEALYGPGSGGILWTLNVNAIGAELESDYLVGVDVGGVYIQSPTPEWYALVAAWEEKMHVLESFNGRYFFALPGETHVGRNATAGLQMGSAGGGGGGGGVATIPIMGFSITYLQGHVDFLTQAYNELRDSIYQSLLLQTRFKSVMDTVSLTSTTEGLLFDFSGAESFFQNRISENAATGISDLIEFNRTTDSMLLDAGWNGWNILESVIREQPMSAELQAVYNDLGITVFGDGDDFMGYSDVNEHVSDEVVFAGAGLDEIHGEAGDDFIFGNGGDDQLYGDTGNDVLVSGVGDDYLSGGSDDDRLAGDAGDDYLYGGSGNDVLDGGEGNDTLHDDGGSNIYRFGRGSGQDVIYNVDSSALGTNPDMVLIGGVVATGVTVSRIGYNLIIHINNSTDVLTISNYFYLDGESAYGIESIQFDDGTSWDVEIIKALVLRNTDGNDVLTGYATNDVIDGGDGNDIIYGNDGNDSLLGGGQSDALYGGVGNDILYGGKDNDVLNDVDGDDVYIFSNGDGQDDIYDYNFNYNEDGILVNNNDVIQFQNGITPGDVTIWRDISHLYLSVGNSGDRISVNNWFDTDEYRVEHVEFNDGTVWGVTELSQAVFLGTQNNDYIYGTEAADVINGLGGDDYLDGTAGNDVYIFGHGSGNDTIYEYDPQSGNSDTVQIAEGILSSAVTLSRNSSDLFITINATSERLTIAGWYDSVESRVERIEFSNGTVWNEADLLLVPITGTSGVDYLTGTDIADVMNGLAGNDYLEGWGGNDVIDGGAGDDYMDGGAGNDTYLFARGADADVIYSNDTGIGKTDVIQFAEGILSTDVMVTRSDLDLILTIAGTTDQITVSQYFSNDVTSGYRLDEIRFTDGTVWNINMVKYMALLGTDAAQTLTGYATGDRIFGRAGDDVIYGEAGADSLYGDNGNDTLFGGADNDLLSGHRGTDVLNGGSGDDYLIGGMGNDTLTGDAGNDTYMFERGTGRDTINNYDTGSGKTDRIQFIGLPNEITVSRSNLDLILTIAGTTDQMTVSQYFTDDVTSSYRLEEIRFAYGPVWDINTVKEQALLGTAAAQTLTGYATGDYINGAGGNDVIYGAAGDDTLYGGTGNDTLNGGTGNDTYSFERGTGQDTITDTDETTGNIDHLLLSAGINPNQLWFSRTANNLQVGIIGSTDLMTINNWYTASSNHVEQFNTANGSQLLLDSQVENLVSAMAAFGVTNPATFVPTAQQQSQLDALVAANWQAA